MNADWQSFVIASAAKASKSRVQSPKRNPENANQPLERFRRSDLRTPAGGKGKDCAGPRSVGAVKFHPNSLSRHRCPWPCQGWAEIGPERDRTAPVFRHDNFPLRRCAVCYCGRKSTSCLASRNGTRPVDENPSQATIGSPYACRQPPGSDGPGDGRSRSGRAGHLGAPSWPSPFRAGCVEMER